MPEFPSLTDSNDWSTLRLNQLAIRRNVGVHYRIPGTLEIAIGPSSTDLGKTEGGKTEGGKTEGGKTEGGKTEGGAGFSDLGKTEGGVVFGKTEGGSGDAGRGLFGGGDNFKNDPFNPAFEIDADFAVNLPPPYEFKACVIGDCTIPGAPTTPFHRVWVTFKPVGGATSYVVYRVSGTTLTQGQTWMQVASLPAVLGQQQYSIVDPFILNQGEQVVYFAVSVFPSGVSEPSNWIPIVGKNDPPVAQNDSYSTNANTPLVVPAAGVLANDSDSDGPAPTATKLTNPAHGTVTVGLDGSFTYVPAAGYSGPDSFTYDATFGTTRLTATVNITVNQVVVPFTFVGLLHAPPAASKSFNAGSVIPMGWQYKNGATAVDSGQLTFTVTMRGPLPAGTLTNTDPGSSGVQLRGVEEELELQPANQAGERPESPGGHLRGGDRAEQQRLRYCDIHGESEVRVGGRATCGWPGSARTSAATKAPRTALTLQRWTAPAQEWSKPLTARTAAVAQPRSISVPCPDRKREHVRSAGSRASR